MKEETNEMGVYVTRTWLRNERVSLVVIVLPASGRMNPHSGGVHQHSQRIRR